MLWFGRLADGASKTVGNPLTFALAVVTVVIWAVVGPLFDYSEGWQLVVNTGTTIITFLCVFLLQHAQNRDTLALHTKLDALIKASEASNALIALETKTEAEIEAARAQEVGGAEQR